RRAGPVDRVVVRANNDPLLSVNRSRQNRNHVIYIHVLRDSRSARGVFLHAVVIVADLQPWAVAAKLLVNPSPRRADTAIGIILRRTKIARAESLHSLERRSDPLLGNFGN